MGLNGDQTAQLIYLGILAVVIGAGIFRMAGRKVKWGENLKYGVYWIIIAVVLMAVYVFRYDAKNVGDRMLAGLVPGKAVSQNIEGENIVTIVKSGNDHFEVESEVNGYNVRFLVDTGATSIVLSYVDARKIGVRNDELNFTIPTQTANGVSYMAPARIDEIKIGEIKRNNVIVLVTMPGILHTNLLGQQFLESLKGYEKIGDRLILRD